MRQVWPFLAERQMAACTIGYLATVVLVNWQVIPWPLVAAVANALVLAGAEQALRNVLGGPAAGAAQCVGWAGSRRCGSFAAAGAAARALAEGMGEVRVREWWCAGVIAVTGALVICGWAAGALAGRVDKRMGGWDVGRTA